MSNEPITEKEQRRIAFEALVYNYQAQLLRYASRIVCDVNAAQDVVQNTFIKLFKNWEGALEASSKLSAWLYRVAHNCAVDYLRHETRRKNMHTSFSMEQDEILQPDVGEAFLVSEEATKAVHALHTLSMREQQLVILKIYEGKSYKEISDITELTIGNVGYILHHAMKKMAIELKKAKAL